MERIGTVVEHLTLPESESHLSYMIIITGERVRLESYSHNCFTPSPGTSQNYKSGCVNSLNQEQVSGLKRIGFTNMEYLGEMCYCHTDVCNNADTYRRGHAVVVFCYPLVLFVVKSLI